MTASRGDEKRRRQAENCHQQVVTAGSTDDVDPITSGHLVVTPGDVGDVDPVTTHRSGERMAGKRGDGGMVSAAMITGGSGTTCHHPGCGDGKRRGRVDLVTTRGGLSPAARARWRHKALASIEHLSP